jgi:secreted trypsin-like serine protease
MFTLLVVALSALFAGSATAVDQTDCLCRTPNATSSNGSPVYPWIVSLSKLPDTPWGKYPELFEGKSAVNSTEQSNDMLNLDDSFDLVRLAGNRSSLSDFYKVNRHFCSGIILNEQWILTAASCVNTILPYNLAVGLNMDNDLLRIYNQGRLEVQSISFHTQFSDLNVFEKYFDVALVKLKHRLQFNEHVQPACFLTNELTNHEESQRNIFTAIGWGASTKVTFNGVTEHRTRSEMSRYLKSVELVDVSSTCTKDNSHACFERSTTSGAMLCDGDAGSPVMINHEGRTSVISMMSLLIPVRSAEFEVEYCSGPYVTTRISHYIRWINRLIQNNLCLV